MKQPVRLYPWSEPTSGVLGQAAFRRPSPACPERPGLEPAARVDRSRYPAWA